MLVIDLQKGEWDNNRRDTRKTTKSTTLKCFFLFVFLSDPPTVKVETSALEHLEDEKDSVTLRCKVDSNPVGAILWRKDGLEGIFSPEQEIVFSPVTRHTAGLYSCTAENQLGMSKPDFVELDVKCKFYFLKFKSLYYHNVHIHLDYFTIYGFCRSPKSYLAAA